MLLLRTLGGVGLLARTPEGERHVDIQAKRLALLVFLARRGREAYVRRDVLLSLFWPEADEQHGRGVLRQALSAFRKQLGPDVVMTHGEEEVGLRSALLACDAQSFEDACATGAHETACGLYHGDFLAGFHATGVAVEFEQWVDAERDRLRRLARDAAWSTARDCEKAGRAAEAVRWAHHAVDLEPDDEAGVARLIALLDRQGNRSGALAAYAALERRLADEYSALPAPETRALMQSLLQRPVPVEASPRAEAQPTGSTPTPTPGTQASASSRPMPRLLAAGIGALAMVMLAVLLGPARSAPHPVRAEAVAVVPFRLHSPATELGWLQEGMVELLTMRLSGAEGVEVVEPGRVLAAWRDVAPRQGAMPPDALRRVAATTDASRLVQGSITGSPAHLVVAAWVLAMPSGRTEAEASVEGPADSLPFLLDQLGARLLGLAAGIDRHRLASLAGVSPPAIRAFLSGRAAFARGNPEEAVIRFREALALDSSFALAGLDLARALVWVGTDTSKPRGIGVAVAHRDRLGAADRALLDAMRLGYAGAPGMFERWRAATTAYPERPETWYALGDAYFHWGALAGMDDALVRAERAFRHGWALDSVLAGRYAPAGHLIAEPIRHMVELAHARGDTAEVLRLTSLVLGADSSSSLANVMRWHRAAMQDAEVRRRFWSGADQVALQTVGGILRFTAWTGVGNEQYAEAAAEFRKRTVTRTPGSRGSDLTAIALNGGRPNEVPVLRTYVGYAPREDLRRRVKEALHWGGDPAAAAQAVRELSRASDALPLVGDGARARFQDVCALGLWRAEQGDTAGATTAARRLRATRIPGLTGSDSASFVQIRELCPALLDASRAVAAGAANAVASVALADSLARTYVSEVCCGEAVIDANLILAQLWERVGDPAAALRAIRRRAGGYSVEMLFLSTFLREEARLAALTGDTAGAIHASRHYLALRPHPAPTARDETVQVEQELALLARRNPD